MPERLLEAAQATYISSANPDTNYDDNPLYQSFQSGKTAVEWNILLDFDISEVPGVPRFIPGCKLELYLTADNSDESCNVSTVLASFDETTVTWNTAPTWSNPQAICSYPDGAGWYELSEGGTSDLEDILQAEISLANKHFRTMLRMSGDGNFTADDEEDTYPPKLTVKWRERMT